MNYKSIYWMIVFAFAILHYGCNNSSTEIVYGCYSCIDSMRIEQHPTVGPNSIVFKIYTNDSVLEKAVIINKMTKISIEGSFFNDSLFYFTKPNIDNGGNKNTFYVFTHTSNFINFDQRSLDSIAQSVVGEINVFVQNDTNKWVIQKCEKKSKD